MIRQYRRLRERFLLSQLSLASVESCNKLRATSNIHDATPTQTYGLCMHVSINTHARRVVHLSDWTNSLSEAGL